MHYRVNFYYVDPISKKPKDLVLLENDIILKTEPEPEFEDKYKNRNKIKYKNK